MGRSKLLISSWKKLNKKKMERYDVKSDTRNIPKIFLFILPKVKNYYYKHLI